MAFRVLAANQQPDHATLARFRARHQDAIAELFSQVLGLCLSEGMVVAGVRVDRWHQGGGERVGMVEPDPPPDRG